jgi:putative transposase
MELNRQGIAVARCTMERLMRDLGLHGVRRGSKIRTTVSGRDGHRAGDLLNRDFTARPQTAGGLPTSPTWPPGPASSTSPSSLTSARGPWWVGRLPRTRAPSWSQYTLFTFTAYLLEAGIDASISSVGDANDNALMESTIGLFKTVLIKLRRSWRSLPRSSRPPRNTSTGTTQ